MGAHIAGGTQLRPGFVYTEALPMLRCWWHYRAGFHREGSVFPDAEGGVEGFKMESEAHGEGVTRAANENAGAVAFAAGIARGAQGVLGSAGGCDGPGNPAGPGDAISPGVPGGSGHLADPRAPALQ